MKGVKGKPAKAVKTANRTMKGVKQGAKSIKTAQRSAKAAQRTAQATAKAAKAAAHAARAAAKATVTGVKAAVKVTATAIKAAAAAIKGLIALIAAGGWVAVVIILLICLIALIVGSCFGLFFGSEPTGTWASVTQAVAALNGEYQAHIQEIEAANPHDRQEVISNNGILSVNWEDVLAVFSAKVTGAEDGSQVASLDDAQVDELRSIMWEMNAISYTTRTESSSVEVTSTDENGNEVTSTETVTETILEITITHKTPEEMAQQYSFNDRQNEYLALMTEPENENLWAELLGGYVSGGGQIIDPNTNWEGTGIFQWPLKALSFYFFLSFCSSLSNMYCSSTTFFAIYSIMCLHLQAVFDIIKKTVVFRGKELIGLALENIMTDRQAAIKACFYKSIFDLEKAQKSKRVSVPFFVFFKRFGFREGGRYCG